MSQSTRRRSKPVGVDETGGGITKMHGKFHPGSGWGPLGSWSAQGAVEPVRISGWREGGDHANCEQGDLATWPGTKGWRTGQEGNFGWHERGKIQGVT